MLNALTQLAHEVYVLTPGQTILDQQADSPNPFTALSDPANVKLFLLFAVLTLAILVFALFLKSIKPMQRLGKFIDKASVFAPDLIRVAFGASLVLSATNNSLFGPELPLYSFPMPEVFKVLLLVAGIGLILGVLTSLFAALAGLFFVYGFLYEGIYMLTYVNYLGEALAVMLFPVQNFSVDRLILRLRKLKPAKPKFAKYSMPTARLLFGFSLLWTALSVKLADSALSLDVVEQYNLTDYFQFDPLFIVLGAALVESLIAILYMLGLLQRFNTVFFLIFLTLSITFFKEDIWPHYLLIALGIGIFLHKPDDWALDKYLFAAKRKRAK